MIILQITACTTIILSVIVLFGWQLNIRVLKSILPDAPQTTPLTATILLIAGITLLSSIKKLAQPNSLFWSTLYKSLSLLLLILGVWTLVQYIFNLPPGIETILYHNYVVEQSKDLPGRPSIRTAVSTVITATSFLMAASKKNNILGIALILPLINLIIPWFSLFGYTTLSNAFYSLPNQPDTGMSPITAIGFIIISFGIMSFWPDKGIFVILNSRTSAGKIIKMLLPTVTIIPLIFSWGANILINSSIDFTISIAFNWGFATLILAAILIWGGTFINKKEWENIQLMNHLKNEKEKFSKLLEAAPDAMVIVDSKGTIQLINEQTTSLFGYSKEELIDKKVEILIPDKSKEKHEMLRTGFFNNEHYKRMMGVGLDLEGIRKNNSVFPVEIALSPIKTQNDFLVTAAVRDVSLRKHHEQEIINSIENLEYAQEIAKIGYFETDYKLTEFNVSDNFCKLFGIEKKTLKLQEFKQIIHENDFERVINKYKQSIAYRENFHTEFRIINPKTKKEQYVNKYIYLRYDSNNTITKVIGLIQDITQQKQIETEIRSLNQSLEEKVKLRTYELKQAHDNLEKIIEKRTEQLKQSNNELEAFSYSVSHDLRAPLRAITGFGNILKKEYTSVLDSEGKRILSIIIHNVSKMGHLIDDILTFSRLSRSQITTSNLNMENIFNNVFEALKALEPTDRNINIKLSPLPPATGDRAMVTQAVTNLLSNALKYTKTKESTQIDIGSMLNDGQTVYFVKDNGVGFDERHKNKLFEVFQRLHNERDFPGTGIGLAIVRRVISKHGGRVWGESIINEGATFYFTLS